MKLLFPFALIVRLGLPTKHREGFIIEKCPVRMKWFLMSCLVLLHQGPGEIITCAGWSVGKFRGIRVTSSDQAFSFLALIGRGLKIFSVAYCPMSSVCRRVRSVDVDGSTLVGNST